MRHPAFTLLELLIAIALVALLAGIVLPVGVSRFSADGFAQAQRQLAAAVIIARADAQRRGGIIRLVVRQDAGAATLWTEDAEQPSDDGPTSRRSVSTPRREFVLDLPSGVRIELAPPSSEDESSAAETGGEADEEAGDSGAGFARGGTVCLLLPDGSVIMPHDLLMVSDSAGGRAVRIRLNRWTGEAEFPPFVREEAEAAPPAPLHDRQDSGAQP